MVNDEVLHYRVDTRDSEDCVENSFIVGGETVVLECQAVGATEWTLASIKGPQLWTEVEVRSQPPPQHGFPLVLV